MIEEHLSQFAADLDSLKQRIFAKVGATDSARLLKLNYFSRTMEVIGRVLIYVSFEPILFALGVLALFGHKQLHALEIGHAVLHGSYDKLDVPQKFKSRTFKWDMPVDEASWRHGHNGQHHGSTNIAGKDSDILFGTVRFTKHTPYSKRHCSQVLFALFILFPNFTLAMATHFTGINEFLFGGSQPDKTDFLPDNSSESVRRAFKTAGRKFLPYYLKEYVFFPLLAGWMFWKIILGNYLAALLRDLYTAITICCNHVGADVKSYPKGTIAKNKADWYVMQVESSNNFTVPRPLSILCGGLDLQIEHHLFPTLPPDRLREIAPEVRAICKKYGVEYKSDTWWRTFRKAMSWISTLSHQDTIIEES